MAVSAARLLNLLASNGLRRILRYNGWRDGSWEEDEDDEDDLGGYPRYRRRTANSGRDELPKVPSDEGTKLMGSGDFGSNPYFVDVLKKRKRSLATKLMWRELGVDVDNSQRRPVQSIAQVRRCDLSLKGKWVLTRVQCIGSHTGVSGG